MRSFARVSRSSIDGKPPCSSKLGQGGGGLNDGSAENEMCLVNPKSKSNSRGDHSTTNGKAWPLVLTNGFLPMGSYKWVRTNGFSQMRDCVSKASWRLFGDFSEAFPALQWQQPLLPSHTHRSQSGVHLRGAVWPPHPAADSVAGSPSSGTAQPASEPR